MTGWLAALALAGGAAATGGANHPLASSRLRVAAAPEAFRLELRLQELTLREVPEWMFDRDNDGRISTLELEDAWPEVADYLQQTVWFELDGARHAPPWTLAGFEDRGDPLPGGGSWFEHALAAAEIPRPFGTAALTIHSDLFLEAGNPEHKLFILVEGLFDRPLDWWLGYARRDWTVELPTAGRVLARYVGLGFGHVLAGRDHLAFVAALLFGVAGLGALVAAVTAFTLAHSLTLAASALGGLTLPPAAVEPAIALSVLLVLLAHLRLGPARAHAWLPAFAFGLLHGFGFAGVLGEIGLPSESRALGLLGFNLGVEAGQLAFVLPLAALAAAARRLLPAAGWTTLRRTAALLLLAFAVLLVGGALRSWWLRAPAPLPEVWIEWLLGAAAAAAGAVTTLLVGRGAAPAERLRPLVAQAVLLAACYAAGVALAGLRA